MRRNTLPTLTNPTTRMLKHLSILLLILSTLSYSSVWAMDSHSDEDSNHEQSHLVDAQPGDSGHEHELDDDHCCHAGAHLLGLLEVEADMSMPAIHANISLYSFHLNAHLNSPPQRPPLS